MRKNGTVIRWDGSRGFGFIRSDETVADIFFHIKDYGENRHPAEGTEVTFDEIHVGGKGPRALKVEPTRNAIRQAESLREDPIAVILPRAKLAPRSAPPHLSRRERQKYWGAIGLMLFWLLLWLTGIALGRFSTIPVFSSLIILNLITFYLYMRDKSAAQEGDWRISEKQLHTMALLGGWPGAWFAQRAFNHKTIKASFQAIYWAAVALNIMGLLAWLIWPALEVSA